MCSSRSLREGHTSELGSLWEWLVSVYHSYHQSGVADKYNGEEPSFYHSYRSSFTSYLLIHVAQINFPWWLAGLHLENSREMSRHHFCVLWSSNTLWVKFWLQILQCLQLLKMQETSISNLTTSVFLRHLTFVQWETCESVRQWWRVILGAVTLTSIILSCPGAPCTQTTALGATGVS